MSKKKTKRAKRFNPLAPYQTAKVVGRHAYLSMDGEDDFSVKLYVPGEVGRFVRDSFHCPPSMSPLAKYDCWLDAYDPNNGEVTLRFGTVETYHEFLVDCGAVKAKGGRYLR